jgi:endonuclease/exonuclease/phosphatase family metal-dependent hydrolase
VTAFDITQPPAAVVLELQALQEALDAAPIPTKQLDRNLLIATWNIRALGDLTDKWRSEPGDSPRRDLGDLCKIATILSRFDVIAIQEVRGASRALRLILDCLGDNWAFMLTDVTKGRPGNSERIAFLFDRRRIRPSGLACEIVEPDDSPLELTATIVRRQFARTPYAVGFASERLRFTLITLHVLYGDDPADRIPELTRIAEDLATWAKAKDPWAPNLIALGDFNIDRLNDPLFQALTHAGLRAPDALNSVRRTIFDGETNHSFYDQIAWFMGGDGTPLLSFGCLSAGTFDFAAGVPAAERQAFSFRMSDHYPLWAEFSLKS